MPIGKIKNWIPVFTWDARNLRFPLYVKSSVKSNDITFSQQPMKDTKRLSGLTVGEATSDLKLRPSTTCIHRYLVDAVGHGLKRQLARPVRRLAVVGGAPAGAVDVNDLRHVADGRGLDDVRHEGLVQHPDSWGSVKQPG